MFHKFIYKMTLITCSMSHFNRNSHFIRFTRATGCCKDPGIKNSTRRKNLPLQLVRNSEKSISNDLSSSKYPSTDSWPSPVFLYNAVHRERAFSAVQLNRSLGNIERERVQSRLFICFDFTVPRLLSGREAAIDKVGRWQAPRVVVYLRCLPRPFASPRLC